MTGRPSLLLGLLAAAFTTVAVAAPPVYRCGSSYADRPCPDARTVEVVDDRTAAERHAATRVAAAERALGTELERDRQARERNIRLPDPARLDRAPPPPPTGSIPKHRRKPERPKSGRPETDDFITTTPAPPRKRG